jgi:hypothetical protein
VTCWELTPGQTPSSGPQKMTWVLEGIPSSFQPFGNVPAACSVRADGARLLSAFRAASLPSACARVGTGPTRRRLAPSNTYHASESFFTSDCWPASNP